MSYAAAGFLDLSRVLPFSPVRANSAALRRSNWFARMAECSLPLVGHTNWAPITSQVFVAISAKRGNMTELCPTDSRAAAVLIGRFLRDLRLIDAIRTCWCGRLHRPLARERYPSTPYSSTPGEHMEPRESTPDVRKEAAQQERKQAEIEGLTERISMCLEHREYEKARTLCHSLEMMGGNNSLTKALRKRANAGCGKNIRGKWDRAVVDGSPHFVTDRFKLYLKKIEDVDDPMPCDLWCAVDDVRIIAYAHCYESGSVQYIDVVNGAFHEGVDLEMCLALDVYYRGKLSLDSLHDEGEPLASALNAARRKQLEQDISYLAGI